MSEMGGNPGSNLDPAPLTDREKELVARLLSDPFFFPQEFYTWLKAKLESDPPLFTSATIFGFRSTVAGIAAATATQVPVGTIVDYGGSADPDEHWLLCDHRLLDRDEYALLYTAIGFSFSSVPGVDPGGNQFHIPDGAGRQRVQKGPHADVDTLGENDGEAAADRTNKHHHLVPWGNAAGFNGQAHGDTNKQGDFPTSGGGVQDRGAFLVVNSLIYVG